MARREKYKNNVAQKIGEEDNRDNIINDKSSSPHEEEEMEGGYGQEGPKSGGKNMSQGQSQKKKSSK